MAVIVMICFSRSGGTLLNQCLGCLPNTVILSEVSPLVSGSGEDALPEQTVKEQAKKWYQIELNYDDFFEGIFELEKICEDTGKYLIVRDWASVNFIPPANYQLTNKLITLDGLKGKCNVIPFAFIRDAIDVWISYRCPDAKDFFAQYLCYVKAIIEEKMPIFKYEEFSNNPGKIINAICNTTDLEYSDSYKEYANFDKVTGDIKFSSRGRKQSAIKPLRRRLIPREKVIEVNNCSDMIEANRLLSYPISYDGAPQEKIWTNWMRGVSKVIGKL